MPLSQEPVPWYIVYNKIADRLLELYEQYHANTGLQLFKLVNTSNAYVRQNLWLKNTSRIKIPSIDPIQLFVSFSRAKQSESKRTEVINAVWKLLRGRETWQSIDFGGCPTPVALNLLLVRPLHVQEDIWKTFSEAMTLGRNLITPELWEKVKSWKGIEIPSFTIFLFWIKSNDFLPLDKNTRILLEYEGFLNARDRLSYDTYRRLLNEMNNISFVEFSAKAFAVNEGRAVSRLNSGQRSHDRSLLDFRLVGIRILKRNSTVHKVLEPFEYYPFDRTFVPVNKSEKKDDIDKFSHISDDTDNLYEVSGLKVRINAIVGKNGCGKSSLLDLVLMGIYNLSVDKAYLDKNLHAINKLNFELYWYTDTLYKLRFEKDIEMYRFRKINGEKRITTYTLRKKPFPFQELHNSFFYAVLINYSHYALNSLLWKPDWITPLSHKNDRYKVPVVINPQRTEGNIEINREKDLLNMRLLVNLLTLHDEQFPAQSFRRLDKEKNIRYFSVSLNESKMKDVNDYLSKEKFTEEVIEIIMDQVETAYGIKKMVKTPFRQEIERYIVYKLSTLISRYDPYKKLYDQDLRKVLQKQKNEETASILVRRDLSNLFSLHELIENVLSDIRKDSSHITFKFKQAVYFLIHSKLHNKINEAVKKRTPIELDVYNKDVTDIRNKYEAQLIEVQELIPPAIFRLDFHLDDKDKSSLSKASSGEFQLLSVLSSILYHIRNIDSVDEDEKYRYITLVLDEIELYFHPDMQRFFVKRLLDALAKMEPKIFGLHILFSTHSPFILSDLQQQNILKLDKGLIVPPKDDYNTFAANIHDLLADEFFLTDSSMGAFAQKKIASAITLLNYMNSKREWEYYNSLKKRTKEAHIWLRKWKDEMTIYCDRLKHTEYWNQKKDVINWDVHTGPPRVKALIESIGEPLIKGKLLNLYQAAFEEKSQIEQVGRDEIFG